MAVTLEQAKVGMADKVDQMVIDEFRRGSFLLDNLLFDDVVSPGTGGSTMTYGYQQIQTPSFAGFRKINAEYVPQNSVRVKKTADIKIFGGSAEIDRIIQKASGAVSEVDRQLKDKIAGARNLFHYSVINGDKTQNEDEFDGLDVMLTGKSSEYNTDSVIDLSTAQTIESNYKRVLDMLDEFLSEFDGEVSMLMGNAKLMSKLRSCARRSGYLTQSENSFGKKIEAYGNTPLVDLGMFFNGTNTVPCSPIYTTGMGETAVTGLTDLYGICIGLDGFHAISIDGSKIINTYLPDLNAPGAVKKVEVEMAAAVVLKNSKKSGVFRGIKVQ